MFFRTRILSLSIVRILYTGDTESYVLKNHYPKNKCVVHVCINVWAQDNNKNQANIFTRQCNVCMCFVFENCFGLHTNPIYTTYLYIQKQNTYHVWNDIIKTRCARQITIFKRKKCIHVYVKMCMQDGCSRNAASASPISNRCTEEIFNQLGWVFSPILFALFIAIASIHA